MEYLFFSVPFTIDSNYSGIMILLAQNPNRLRRFAAAERRVIPACHSLPGKYRLRGAFRPALMVQYAARRCDMSKILIVEDDLSIQALLHDFIEEAGHSVVLAADGVEALAKYSQQPFDLILLDIMLPKIDGYSVCEVIRQRSDVPIIMLTALDGEESQIRGLDLQADDYITKPFSMPVLLRKIAAVLRRSSKQNDTLQTITYKDLMLDLAGYKVYVRETQIDLTPREFEILRELLMHKGRILTRQNLLQTLWRYEFYGDERIIDTHIKNLRKKLGTADYIETIRGVGYRIDKEDQKQPVC